LFVVRFIVSFLSKQNFQITVYISSPVQTGPGAHPASYTIGTGDKAVGA